MKGGVLHAPFLLCYNRQNLLGVYYKMFCKNKIKYKNILAFTLSAFLIHTASYANSLPDDYGGKICFAPDPVMDAVSFHILGDNYENENGDENTQVMPLKLDADKAEYNQETGDFFAEGNVILRQNGQIVKTDYAEGNMNTGDIYLKDGGEIVDGDTTIHGAWGHYNFLKKVGEIEKIDGYNSHKEEWYHSPSAKIQDGKVVCNEGAVVSRCPSVKHPPCLSIEAKSFEVIPHREMIAKDCWVKIRGAKIMHRDRWVNDLTRKNRQTKFMPHIGWEKDYGMKYYIEIEQPTWKGGRIGGDLIYYGMAHWKPWYYLEHDTKDFSVELGNGWVDDDGEWYKKQMNWEVHWKRHRIIKGLPLSYSAFLEHGLWKRKDDDGNYSPRSWHTEYGAYIYHDPIHLFGTQKNSLNLYVGKKWVRESFIDEHNSTNMYGATFTQKFGDDFKAWVGYYDAKKTSNLFDLNDCDMENELRPGIQYNTPNGRDVFTGVYRLDVGKGKRYEYILTWLHHFCCWDLTLSYEREYEEQDHKLNVQYQFNFM